jgi:autotransporter-associated beta strand protein
LAYLVALLAIPIPVLASGSDTVSFNPSDPGVTKSVATWGVDTAWPNYDNVRQSVANIGQANVDEVRLTFDLAQPLVQNADGTFSLNTTAKSEVDAQLNLASLAGSKPLTLVPGALPTTFDQTNWVRVIKATQEYINSKPAFAATQIKSIEAFNEPDYWGGEGTPAQLNAVITQLKTYPVFANTTLLAASTLNSDSAQTWYDQAPAATGGSSHLLGGSLTSWVSFIDHVNATGKPFANPELHSLGEAIVGADHGMTAGIFWADALRARGLFVQASDGKQIGYYEDLPRQSAAAVYRAPDGHLYAFAGGLERFGRATSYRFVSNTDVYFNGIPVRQYVLQTKWDENASSTDNDFANYGSWSSQGAYAEITTDGSGDPALDGYRWKIVNVQTGQVLQVSGSATGDGALINSAADNGGALNQLWNISRTRNGYYELFNANSGRTIGVNGASLASGATLLQYGHADTEDQQWYLQSAGNGTFYLRDAWSNEYLTSSTVNSFQSTFTGSGLQQWKFVLANPTSGPKAQYLFAGNANDKSGTYNATAFGSPTYVAGPPGSTQAIKLNGSTDYLQLPAPAVNSPDITIAATVKWDGGNAWQRLFDFGNNTTSYMFLTPNSGDGTMRFAITKAGSDNEQVLDTSPLPIGQWVQLTLTLGGNTGILYVNGKPQVAGQILLNPSTIAPTLNYIGKSQFADPLFNGLIADFRIYNYALAQSQVASLVPYRWTGGLNSIWTPLAQSNPKNWQLVATASDYADGDVVLFDDNAGNFNVTVTSTGVSPASVLFDDSTHDYTLSGLGPITGSATLTKNGSAALTITNRNTYTGGTLLNAGTLNINNGNAIGTGPLTMANGVTLDNTSGSAITLSTTNAQTWNGNFTFAGSNPLNMGSGAVTLTGNRAVTVNGTGPLTVGPIGQSGGSWSLTKAGPGTLVLSAPITYTGGTTINGGTITTAGTTPFNSAAGTVTVNDGATLNFAPGPARLTHQIATLTLSGSGTVDLNNHELLTNTDPGTIHAYLARAYNATGSADWSQPGLTSTLARSSPTIYTVGYAFGGDQSAQDAGVTTNSGSPLSSIQTIVRTTLTGDANLDGKVDFFDLTQLLAYKYNTGQPASYTDGDLNYDGVVDFFDLSLLLSANYNSGQTYAGMPSASASPSTTTAIAPEPAGLGLLAAVLLLARRRLS